MQNKRSLMLNDKESTSPWSLDESDLLNKFGIIKTTGRNQVDADELLKVVGENALRTEKVVRRFTIFLNQFKNPMSYMLIIATIIALVLGQFLDSIAIMAILFLNAFIGFIQEAKASEAIQALKELSVPKARVLRDGKTNEIPSEKVVPGDILLLEAGDYVTADARVLESNQLKAEEAPLTGESIPIRKEVLKLQEDIILSDRKNMLHAGTAISNGSGKAIVTSTGMNTEIGKIAQLLHETEIQETPLQLRLKFVTYRLLMLGAIVIVLVVIIRYLENESWFNIFMSAISLAVAAIPEGLPTVVSLALALAVKRMTKRNTIIRHLSAVETLGSTDVICTDKTGTLTTGKMKVREVFLISSEKRTNFIEGMVLCNNASIDNHGSGDPTEIALLEYAFTEGFSIEDIKSRFNRLYEWSFDSERKSMSVAVKDNNQVKIITKGAPEIILKKSNIKELEKNKIVDVIHSFTSKGYRLLAVAEKIGEIFSDPNDVENKLEFIGLVAMADPPRPETIDSIQKCKNAGIKVVMITGDHPETAKAIASELGIIIPGSFDNVLTGSVLEKMSLDELKKSIKKTAVYARVSPAHKLNIVEALQSSGHIVAMTGDGVNDAPALKKAQIGISMGKGGTEVARQASNMVLVDDNFATIVHAVEEGRAIYGNIKRTIQYLLSTNLSELLIVLGASILSLPVPFTPIGLLWINLVTDGFPSLALAAEPISKDILKETKRPSPSTFFDRSFILELFFVGLLMTIICLSLFYYKLNNGTEEEARTYAFTLLVFMTLFRSFSCRSENLSIFELRLNYYHLVSVLFPISLQLIIDESEIYQKIFKIKELDSIENVFIIFLALIPVAVIEFYKIWRRK